MKIDYKFFIPEKETLQAIGGIIGIWVFFLAILFLVGYITIDKWNTDTIKELKMQNQKLTEENKSYDYRLNGFIITNSYAVFISEINPNISIKDLQAILDSLKRNYEKTGLSMLDIISICSHESKLDKEAKNPDNTGVGICQINPSTYNSYKKKGIFKEDAKKLYDIEYNIFVATEILKEHRKILEKKYNVTMFSLKGEIDDFTKNQYKNFIDKLLISSFNIGTKNADSNSKYVGKILEMKERL